MAQQKQFTLDDLIPGGKTYASLIPVRMTTAWWGNNLIKIEGESCFVLDKKNTWQPLFTLKELQEAMKSAHIDDAVKSLNGARFTKDEKTIAQFTTAKSIFNYDWSKKQISHIIRLDAPAGDVDCSGIDGSVAYNHHDNLYISRANAPRLQVSTDGSHDIVYGQSVHRNEFGISKGTYWSPDGNRLCFYRMDQSMVTDYPLVDISTRIATVQPIKYPMAGEKSHKVSMGVIDMTTGNTTWLQTGDNTDQYYTGITWSPDSRKIYLYNLNRDQNHLRLCCFDAATGVKEKELYEETHPKYVEPEHGITFLPWDDDKFIYWSEKDGYERLYLYSLKAGKTLRKLTDQRTGVVLDLMGFNLKTKSVIINATGTLPMQHNFFSVGIEKNSVKLLGEAKGVHSGRLSANGEMLLDDWSAPGIPHRIDLVNTSNGKTHTLLNAEDPWKGYAVPIITSGTIKAADDTTDLYYRMVKPHDFDSTKSYPAIVYVYGGPHARMVNASWNYLSRGWELYMAQKGYIVFVLDNRGSDERGLAFENVTFRRLGTEEMRDQMRGIEFLKSQPYIDANRLGVHGWSYGGFMTTNLMLTYPDVFKCGVAGGPVIDWKYYEIMYGERYMDCPQSNPEGYRKNNLTLRAGDLKGRLLIIFGYNDPVCVPQHTLSFIRACETAGTHPDLLTYPGDGHNMMGKDRIHLHEHITRYFEDHLK